MKKVILLFGLCFCLCMLNACGGADTETNGGETGADAQSEFDCLTVEELAETYDLTSSEILLVTDMDQIFDDKQVQIVKITDPADVETIVSGADFSQWEATGSWAEGIYTWTLVFDDNIGMRLDDKFSYASIGKMELNEDGCYQFVDPQGSKYDYDLPENFSQIMKDMLIKYTE